MKTKFFENPFPVTTYLGSEYFCDREVETSRLLSSLRNENSTTLISLRRIGKTGLIHHLFSQLPTDWKGIYVDILETENLNQFLNLLATSIMKTVPEKSSLGKRFLDFIKSLRPLISFDSLSGSPQISFDIKPTEIENNIEAIFHFLEKQEFKVVVAIDEFQQIVHYPEQNTDAWLRTRIQQLKNVVFIFSGSQQQLMAELFTSPKRPFFRSTTLMKLEKLNRLTYRDFIVSVFEKYKKHIDPVIADEILDWTNTHTYYTQQLCNRVFAATVKEVTQELWKHEAFQLLQEQEPVFFTFRNMLTKPQWRLLKSIAHEGTVFQPTSKSFLEKYQLGTSATVLRSLKTLSDYELVIKEFDKNGASYFAVYDVFLRRWAELTV